MRFVAASFNPSLIATLNELNERLETLEHRPEVDESASQPRTTIINAKGEVEAAVAGAGEYVDFFSDPVMTNWRQAPLQVGPNQAPILSSEPGGLWLPGPTGLKMLGADVGGHYADPHCALLTLAEYYEEGIITKPLLPPYQAVLKFTLAQPMPSEIVGESPLGYGFRVNDAFTWPAAVTAGTHGLGVTVSFHEEKIRLELLYDGGGSKLEVAYNLNNKTFWLVAKGLYGSGVPFWQFEVWDANPLLWTPESTATPLILKTFEYATTTTARKRLDLTNMRFSLELKSINEGVQEVGSTVNYLRVMPMSSTIRPNTP